MRVQEFNKKVRLTCSFWECRILRRALYLSIVTRRRRVGDLPDDFWKESVQSEIALSEQMHGDLLSL